MASNSTDTAAPLLAIRDLHARHGHMGPEQVRSLADHLDTQIARVLRECRLEPRADAGGILAASIEAMTVSAHIELDAIAGNEVVARAIHADAQRGVMREDIVAHHHAVRACHQQRVHALYGAIAADDSLGQVLH